MKDSDMTLSIEQWHSRYQQQARWTQPLRRYIYRRVGMEHAEKVLDVGCGTGILLEELVDSYQGTFFGLDIQPAPLNIARTLVPRSLDTLGDAAFLPFRDKSFTITLCHFFFLWIKDPLQGLCEMVRVTEPGGYVLALAEPDYGGRIDYPEVLATVGVWQIDSLREQGADPMMGRKLMALFYQSGLEAVEVGVLGSQWTDELTNEEIDLEWKVIQSDLSGRVDLLAQAENLKHQDLSARKNRQRILYVPTFYALGKVPG